MGKSKKNNFQFEEDYVIMYDSNGNSTLIDTDDYERVSQHHWIKDINNRGYWRCTKRTKEHGRMLLHRFIMNFPNGLVDHKFHDLDDNRKNMLRSCNKAENNRNKYSPVGVVGHRGIIITPIGKYQARITVNNKQVHLGTFDNIEEAIKIREEAEIKYFGDFRYRSVNYSEES